MTVYLTVAEVVAIHDEISLRTGSSPEALRNEGLLESAIARAQNAAYYEDADLVRQAALMAVGISQNQPFVDGNKRTAYAALDVFLRINGMEYVGDPIEMAYQFEEIANTRAGRTDATEEFVAWLVPRTRTLNA